MKTSIFSRLATGLLFFLLFSNAFAQENNSAKNILANTEWTGLAMIPMPETVNFVFSADKFDLVFQGDVVESMNYSIVNDTISLKKIDGGSPCSPEELGNYNFKIENKTLILSTVKDNCSERSAAFDPKGYMLVEKK